MLDLSVVSKLKSRYPHLHPLLVHRSVQRAKSLGELFDILESVPDDFPVTWNEKTRTWENTKDMLQVDHLSFSS